MSHCGLFRGLEGKKLALTGDNRSRILGVASLNFLSSTHANRDVVKRAIHVDGPFFRTVVEADMNQNTLNLFENAPITFGSKFLERHAGHIMGDPAIALVELVANC